jgi:hypothetical protein
MFSWQELLPHFLPTLSWVQLHQPPNGSFCARRLMPILQVKSVKCTKLSKSWEYILVECTDKVERSFVGETEWHQGMTTSAFVLCTRRLVKLTSWSLFNLFHSLLSFSRIYTSNHTQKHTLTTFKEKKSVWNRGKVCVCVREREAECVSVCVREKR